MEKKNELFRVLFTLKKIWSNLYLEKKIVKYFLEKTSKEFSLRGSKHIFFKDSFRGNFTCIVLIYFIFLNVTHG